MVFRKIEQDVAAFKEAVGSSDLASRLVGRHGNGSSLAIAAPRPDLDDFDYSAYSTREGSTACLRYLRQGLGLVGRRGRDGWAE